MSTNNRRRIFLINRPLQFRYMVYITLPLLIITAVIMSALYIGIWGSVLDVFNDEQLRNDLLTASRLTEYEKARLPHSSETDSEPALTVFKQAEKMSLRQKEAFKEILDTANRRIVPKLVVLLILLAWGSIYVSHRIAGPFYRLSKTMEEIRAGNLRTRFFLRQADEGKFLIKSCNDTLHSLDSVFSRLKNIIREDEGNPRLMTARLKEELSKIKTSADT